MPLSLVAGPTEEPVTLQEAKDHLRVDWDNDDALIDVQIVAAREYCQRFLRRYLITQTWDLFGDAFPSNSDRAIIIPRPPLQSVTSIKYIDTDGVQQTWANTDYTVDSNSEPGQIFPNFGKTYPSARSVRNAVEIRFVAGYGKRESVPRQITHAMLLVLGHLYNNREASLVGVSASEIPIGAHSLLWPFRNFEL